MNLVDVNRLVEQAKADSSAARALSGAHIKEADTGRDIDSVRSILSVTDEEVARLSDELTALAECEIAEEAAVKQAEVERGRNITMAKLLAAIDVLTGVQ